MRQFGVFGIGDGGLLCWFLVTDVPIPYACTKYSSDEIKSMFS